MSGKAARRLMLRFDGDVSAQKVTIEEGYRDPDGQHPKCQPCPQSPSKAFSQPDHDHDAKGRPPALSTRVPTRVPSMGGLREAPNRTEVALFRRGGTDDPRTLQG